MNIRKLTQFRVEGAELALASLMVMLIRTALGAEKAFADIGGSPASADHTSIDWSETVVAKADTCMGIAI